MTNFGRPCGVSARFSTTTGSGTGRQEHVGDYDSDIEHAYRTDASALERAYLDEHGIGAVVVTGDAVEIAAATGYLTPVRTGQWDVYTVDRATSIVTFGGANPMSIVVGNQSLSASGNAAGGEIVVRRNWFPRWEVSVNGASAEITHLDDGYMSIATEGSGAVEVELTYRADWLDWLARLLSLAGLGIAMFMLLPGQWFQRR